MKKSRSEWRGSGITVTSTCVALLVLLLLGAAIRAEESSKTTDFTSDISARVPLHDGNSMPVMGLGVALTAEATYNAVQSALSQGYRLIDTAAEESYGNEDQVGKAIRDYADNHQTLQRKDVFVTTKLWDSDHGYHATLEAFRESLNELNMIKMDLYLMHSPFGGRLIETWDAMLYFQSQGMVKSIGVSNFGVKHLQAIKDSGRPLPVVNQIEMHPLVYQQRMSLIDWCREHNIQIQAYGSMMHGYEDLLSSKMLVDMATRYDKTPAQILLRWALQHDLCIIPKSSRQERIKENSLLYDFNISKEDMDLLDHWGDTVDYKDRNIYKEDWNWNPIDEAPVHLGRTTFWPDYKHIEDEQDYGDDDVYGDDDFGDAHTEL